MIPGIITWLLKGWLSRWALTAEGEIKDGWRWLTASPVHALLGVVAVLLLLCGLFWHEWAVKALQVEHLAGEIAQFKTAQANATNMAREALHHQEQVYQAKAQDADHAYQTQLAAAQSATDRYISTHRVRADVASGAGGTVASASGGGASGTDGPDHAADMVAVSADDINACTVNTQRLQAARDWALGLNQ